MFKAKHAKLGYDAEGSLLHIGMARDEDVWLAFPPKEFFDNSSNFRYVAPGTKSGDTRLSFPNYCRAVVFLAYVMHKHGISDVAVEPSDTWDTNLSTLDGLARVMNLV